MLAVRRSRRRVAVPLWRRLAGVNLHRVFYLGVAPPLPTSIGHLHESAGDRCLVLANPPLEFLGTRGWTATVFLSRTATIRRNAAPETSQHRRQRRVREISNDTADFSYYVGWTSRTSGESHSGPEKTSQRIQPAAGIRITGEFSNDGRSTSGGKGSRFCPICATPISASTPTSYTATEVIPPWQQHRGQWQEWGEARTWSNAPGGNQRLSQSC